mgnify:CR=1 FL=1
MANPKPSPAPAAPAAPAKTADRQVAFSVKSVQAKEVVLTGDFTGWALDRVKLQKAQNGEWQTTLVLPPGEYQYRLRVDGEWRDHEQATRRVPNVFGTENDVLVVR